MGKVIIRSFEDLVPFLERSDVKLDFAHQVTEKVLKVLIIFPFETKAELIEAVRDFIVKFCGAGIDERPIFLRQKEEEFNIKDVFSVNK